MKMKDLTLFYLPYFSSQEKGKALITELENLNFLPKKGIAA